MKTIDLIKGQQTALEQLPSPLKMTMDKAAEIYLLRTLITEYWNNLKAYNEIKYSKIGFDVVLTGNNSLLNIELKASSKKSDYMNQNGKNATLFGNGLKDKDIDLKTGILEADFLIFAAEVDPNRTPSPFDFWIFSRKDLATLYPKATISIPTHIPTIMIKNETSFFNDEFIAFKKGVYQIILPEYDYSAKQWKDSYPDGFGNTWCPLINDEFNELDKVMAKTPHSHYLSNYSKLFMSQINPANNPNFRSHACDLYNPSTTKELCKKCQAMVKEVTVL